MPTTVGRLIETPVAEPAGAGPRVGGAARRSRVLSMQSTGTEDRPTGKHAEARRSKGKSRHLLEDSRKGPLFYADRIKTPYRASRLWSVRTTASVQPVPKKFSHPRRYVL